MYSKVHILLLPAILTLTTGLNIPTNDLSVDQPPSPTLLTLNSTTNHLQVQIWPPEGQTFSTVLTTGPKARINAYGASGYPPAVTREVLA